MSEITETTGTDTGTQTADQGAQDTAATEQNSNTMIGQDDQAATDQTQAEGETQNGETDEGADDKKADDGAPDDYSDFSVQEGNIIDPDVLGDFKEIAKEFNLSQEKAQNLLDKYQEKILPRIAQKQMEIWQQDINGRQAAIKADKEIGGDNLEKTKETVNRVVNTYMSKEEAKEFADYTGRFGDHAVMIKLLTRVGKSIGEDNFIGGNSERTSTRTDADIHKALYPTMFK